MKTQVSKSELLLHKYQEFKFRERQIVKNKPHIFGALFNICGFECKLVNM